LKRRQKWAFFEIFVKNEQKSRGIFSIFNANETKNSLAYCGISRYNENTARPRNLMFLNFESLLSP
jgi:hypothetical protein